MGGITAEPYSYYKVNGLIHNSQEIDKEIVGISENASRKLRNAKMAHYYVCGLNIADTPYTVKFVVTELESGDRDYDHSLTEIEKGELLNRAEVSSTVGKYELNRESAESYLLNELRGEYIINDTNKKFVITRKGAKKVTSHSSESIPHLKSIVVIPQMLENAISIEEVSAEKDNAQCDSYRHYVCGLRLGAEDYTARITIGVKGDSKYYDHRLTQIEKGNLIDNLNSLSNAVAENSSFLVSDSKDTKLIEILQTNSSKVVDENGEPKVTMPSNVVTPSLRAELEKLGVPFKETDNKGRIIKKKGATSSSTVKKTQPIPNIGIRDVARLRKDFVSAIDDLKNRF